MKTFRATIRGTLSFHLEDLEAVVETTAFDEKELHQKILEASVDKLAEMIDREASFQKLKNKHDLMLDTAAGMVFNGLIQNYVIESVEKACAVDATVGNRHKILMLAGNEKTLAFFSNILSGFFDFFGATESSKALAYRAGFQPNLIICSAQGKGSLPLAFLRQVSMTWPEVPLVFESSDQSESFVTEAAKANAADILIRPLKTDKVLKVVYSALGLNHESVNWSDLVDLTSFFSFKHSNKTRVIGLAACHDRMQIVTGQSLQSGEQVYLNAGSENYQLEVRNSLPYGKEPGLFKSSLFFNHPDIDLTEILRRLRVRLKPFLEECE